MSRGLSILAAAALSAAEMSPALADDAVAGASQQRNCAVVEVLDSEFTDEQPRGSVEAGREYELEHVMMTGPVDDVYAALRAQDGTDVVTSCTDEQISTTYAGDQVFPQSANGYRLTVQPKWLRQIFFEDGAHHVGVETPGGCRSDVGPVAPKLAYMELALTGPNGQRETAYLSTDGEEFCSDGVISLSVVEFQRNLERTLGELLTRGLSEQVAQHQKSHVPPREPAGRRER